MDGKELLEKRSKETIDNIVESTASYLKANNINDVVIGNSGGIDSAFCIMILSRIPGLRIHSRYIHIYSNKDCERNRAFNIAESFKTNHMEIDLTNLFNSTVVDIEDNENDELTPIQLGNIKARLRMIYLYNLAHMKNGIVISTDNKTEHMLGFWTLHGDVGDIEPIIGLYKSTIYSIAETLCEIKGYLSEDQSSALKACVNAIPTDGLGITNSDLDQLGASSYKEVDLELRNIAINFKLIPSAFTNGTNSFVPTNVKVYDRFMNSRFKRSNKSYYIYDID